MDGTGFRLLTAHIQVIVNLQLIDWATASQRIRS